ncbi:butyrophilin subfamily 1 member A1-like [Girardinichthys multiradiatus]|uniref:butyrophilin subfamily 1 member A1-like n=1 Tax=Girardinichthys multiradiatus TaxID=208333 RepID=UPI001FACAC6B|nr:butyrophilin subfamily 1 member A1-like [Girardinichthys multiradiatus]
MKVLQVFRRIVCVFLDFMFKGGSICSWAASAQLLFLVAFLSGLISADILPQTITAYVNETVTLPCSIPVDEELPTVEWSKEGLSQNITILYRDGCETFGMKNSAFRYRTNLVLDKLKDGNISQIIYNLRLSDRGRYQCRTLRGRQWQVHAMLELKVVAVSEPKLAVVPTTGGDGVTLECKAVCWFPEPEVTFQDDKGKEIKANNPTRVSHPTECLTVTRKANLQTPINRVICRVHETDMNQTRKTEIYIPDHWMRSCAHTATITGVIIFLLTSFVSFGICFFIQKKSCMRRQNCLSRSGDLDEDDLEADLEKKDEKLSSVISKEDEKIQNSSVDKEKLKSKQNGTLQEDQHVHDSSTSLSGTEQATQNSSCNSSTGSATSKMKYSGPVVSRQDEALGPHSPKSTSSSTFKGPNLLAAPSFHRSLSYRSNASEESESLLEKP